MPEYDVSAVVNPWQAAVLIVLILVVLGGPQVLAWRNSIKARDHARRAADEIEHQSKPNSGLSLKDALNRIEAGVSDLSQRVETLERAAEKRGRRMWRR